MIFLDVRTSKIVFLIVFFIIGSNKELLLLLLLLPCGSSHPSTHPSTTVNRYISPCYPSFYGSLFVSEFCLLTFTCLSLVDTEYCQGRHVMRKFESCSGHLCFILAGTARKKKPRRSELPSDIPGYGMQTRLRSRKSQAVLVIS